MMMTMMMMVMIVMVIIVPLPMIITTKARNSAGWSDFSKEFLFYTQGKGRLIIFYTKTKIVINAPNHVISLSFGPLW